MTIHRLSALACCLSMVAACVGGSTTAESGPLAGPTTLSAGRDLPDDLVNLRLYFRTGTGPKAHLVPVTREVAITEELPRTALELLIAGPTEDDGRDIKAVVPARTRVVTLEVSGSTAHVSLSGELISDASGIGADDETELLALAAMANTLTEFPTIDFVRLAVDGLETASDAGAQVGQDTPERLTESTRFWGGWGLPRVLVRDESVIGPPREGEEMPALARFSVDQQTIGSPQAAPVEITSIRIRDRTTYLRLVVELAEPEEKEAPTAVPPVLATAGDDGAIVVELDRIASYDADLAMGQQLRFDDPAFDAVAVDQADLPGSVRIILTPSSPRQFWLHILTSPTRVVLDVRK